MSDLVRNPENQFSGVEAQISHSLLHTKFCEFEHSDISLRINGENNNIAFVYYVNCLEGCV